MSSASLVLMTALLLNTCLVVLAEQNPTSIPSAASSNLNAQAGSTDLEAKMREGTEEFRKRDYAHARTTFQEVIAVTPGNVVAHNMAGNCSLKLKDYPAAIASFKQALEIQPGESHNETGLMQAYSLSGMTKERESEKEHLRELKLEGHLPTGFSFISDSFEVGDKRIEVVEFFPDLAGQLHYRYWFNVFNSAGTLVSRVALESDDIDQVSWAKEHPREAAAGKRKFSLDGYAGNSHSLYLFYDEGEPPYEKVREEVKRILLGSTKASSSTTMTVTPSPQTNKLPNDPR